MDEIRSIEIEGKVYRYRLLTKSELGFLPKLCDHLSCECYENPNLPIAERTTMEIIVSWCSCESVEDPDVMRVLVRNILIASGFRGGL